ncbi:MAG: glutamate--cysteine ligase [Synechococcales cyanobacterium C42_A2020_086]|jgi:gamma-glutamyl:cysteine ligase YbdK (ATP-grasp superfamily)|nr:glutamate--cysteine ligase [Synechococcales cyanobacterium C42_A2020_086]
MFAFGLEHEVAFLNSQGQFADFTCTSFPQLQHIVEALPLYATDYPQLRIGDAGIKKKRWYVEGFERFADSDQVIDCIPKGIEIRTTIHATIQGVIAELSESFVQLRNTAIHAGFMPVLISFNPYRDQYQPQPPLNAYELYRRQISPEKQTAHIPMLTYGPDLNLSVAGLSTAQLIDIGQKLTYYSPFIIPFSFSSPFYRGELWSGLSVRTFVRTGARPAALVFVEKSESLIASSPSLTKMARIPAEVGRIEFKAFDSCDDFSRYAALLALLKGLILDETLPGRATTPDAALHQTAAQYGFDDPMIADSAQQVLQAATAALSSDPDAALLLPLQDALDQRRTPAHALIEAYRQSGSIQAVLQQTYRQPEVQVAVL